MARSRTSATAGLDLPLELERGRGESLHRQIEAALREGIQRGQLPPGTALPPSRALAEDLGVSRGVVVEAYGQLAAEGYLSSRSGSYTTVATPPSAVSAEARTAPRKSTKIDFCPCRADGSQFPRTAWLQSLRRALDRVSDEEFGYVDSRGVSPLREALSGYLNRSRGTAVRPENVVICNGYAQGVGLVLDALARGGAKRIAVEDPCADDDAVPMARSRGLDVVGVRVGEEGIDLEALERTDADALVLTPSHQWPLGGILPPAARRRVVEWARQREALVIEDDYDTEYCFDGAPLRAMQGLDPERVIYAGTVSKTLAPALRLGWLALPVHLTEAVVECKALADRGSPVLDQLAFADFLTAGEFHRHLRRMRPLYKSRRERLVAALRDHAPELTPAGAAAGLHLVAYLPAGLSEQDLVMTAARRGAACYGLAPYCLTPSRRAALLFGYATLEEDQLERGAKIVGEAIAELRSATA